MLPELIGMVRKDEPLDILTGAWLAHVNGRRYVQQTAESEAFSAGFHAALQAVATSAGLVGSVRDKQELLQERT